MISCDHIRKQIEDALGKSAGRPNTNQAEMMKTIIPIIRNISPTLIAEDIVNVQPMIARPMQIGFTDGIEHPYWVEPMANPSALFNYSKFDEKHQERLDWCIETFNDDDWVASSYKFYFKTEKHRDWFVLKWS